jgi:hypothetical protein
VHDVHCLPFAYGPEVHRPWPEDATTGASSDVVFVRGCDADRIPLIRALIDAKFDVALLGGYWGRHLKTGGHWRGWQTKVPFDPHLPLHGSAFASTVPIGTVTPCAASKPPQLGDVF